MLLIRPLGGTTALWGRFRDTLAESFRVIAYEHPVAVSTRALAGVALHVLDRLADERAHVFGISLGGMVATWFAAEHPARVARLCLASTPVRGLAATRAGVRRELALALSFAGPQTEARLVGQILSRRFRAEQPGEVRRIRQEIKAAPASRASLLALGAAALRHDARQVLGQIQAPTLVLAGSEDHILGVRASRELAGYIRGASFEIIAQAGHDLTLEQPVVTAARVRRHFAGEA